MPYIALQSDIEGIYEPSVDTAVILSPWLNEAIDVYLVWYVDIRETIVM